MKAVQSISRFFANTTATEVDAHNIGPILSVITPEAANEVSGKGVWVQLAPFGKFGNSLGTQVVGKDDADAVVADYKGFANAAKRVCGLPWYIGHPDHPDFKDFYTDTAAKGRIKDLECRHEAGCQKCKEFANETVDQPCPSHGLFALTKFNDDGKALIANESFHGHSVNWKLQRRADGWHPVHLKSVGFTNEPNIPVPAILAANVREQTMSAAAQPTLMDRIKSLLKLKEGANEDDAYGAMESMANTHREMANTMTAIAKRFGANEAVDPVFASLKTDVGLEVPGEGVVVFLANEVKTRSATLKTKDTELLAANERTTKAEGKVTALETDMANERKGNCEQLGALLITGGFLTKADYDTMVAGKDFTKKVDHDAFMANAKSLKPKINVVSGLNLAGRNATTVVEKTNLNGELINMANEFMATRAEKKQKHDWDTCWGLACNSEKGKAILAQMKKPGVARS